MPYHETDDLAAGIAEIEAHGETVVQVIAPKTQSKTWRIITRTPRNDTGDPWLPSWAKETRALTGDGS